MSGRYPQSTQPIWKSYITNVWNWLDLAVHILMFTSFGLHLTLSRDQFYLVRGFYAVTLFLSYIRIINIFYASASLGPLIIMLRDMVRFITI